jgi:hypothetical protein
MVGVERMLGSRAVRWNPKSRSSSVRLLVQTTSSSLPLEEDASVSAV